MGSRELDRRDTDLALERPAQMALADPELAREDSHGTPVECSGANAQRGSEGEARDGIDRRPPGSELGPTAQAGPVPGALRRGGRDEEAAMARRRNARRADWPAVDGGRDDADDKDP